MLASYELDLVPLAKSLVAGARRRVPEPAVAAPSSPPAARTPFAKTGRDTAGTKNTALHSLRRQLIYSFEKLGGYPTR
jgi:hypothetical protein